MQKYEFEASSYFVIWKRLATAGSHRLALWIARSLLVGFEFVYCMPWHALEMVYCCSIRCVKCAYVAAPWVQKSRG